MEALKTKGVARDGILSVPIPKKFENKELEVIILSASDTGLDDEVEKHTEKVKRLMGIVGAVKYPDFPISKYDVYEQ